MSYVDQIIEGIMKKVILLLLVLFMSITAYGKNLNYRFNYKIESDIRKRMYLLYKFKMYYKAQATAILQAKKMGASSYRFQVKKLLQPSYRIRTHRKGAKLSIVTAGMSFNQAKAQYPVALADFKNSAPYYWKMNKTIAKRPFKILPINLNSFSFLRSASGLNSNFCKNIKLVKPSGMKRYNDSFNIYKLMSKMLELHNYSILPGVGLKKMLSSIHSWKSRKMNYTKDLNELSHLADFKSDKYVKFKQGKSFKLKFSLVSTKNGIATIFGVAKPRISVGMGLKIKKVIRKIRIRIKDEVLLQDYFYLDAKDGDNRGWSFVSNLKLI